MGRVELRPEVARFAQAMERRLRANDHKPGWKDDSAAILWVRSGEERLEALRILRGLSDGSLLDELADEANFLMMVADVKGVL